jgi:hypothetical protein
MFDINFFFFFLCNDAVSIETVQRRRFDLLANFGSEQATEDDSES